MTGQFMTQYMGWLDRGVVTLPGMPVATADAVGIHLYDHAVWRGTRIIHLGDRDRATKTFKDD